MMKAKTRSAERARERREADARRRAAEVGLDERRHDVPVHLDTAGQVSSAPFVPYSLRDLAEVEHVAKMLLERMLAPSPMIAESLARAVVTTARMLREADPGLVPTGCLHLRVTRGEDVPRRYGSWRTQLCLDCGAFRTHGHGVYPDPSAPYAGHDWAPASEYAEATHLPRDDD